MKGKIAAVAVLGLVVWLLWRRDSNRDVPGKSELRRTAGDASPASAPERSDDQWVRTSRRTEGRPPEEVVQAKLAKFGKSRRDLALALAKKHEVNMSPEVSAFFDAVEAGDWERIQKSFAAINGGDTSASYQEQRPEDAKKMWPAIIDAFGAAEQVNLLPAQTLLDYGHGILDALRPGMIYVGGTDSSRWVPALLNDTEAGDRHVVITQNGLADSSYLDYVACNSPTGSIR